MVSQVTIAIGGMVAAQPLRPMVFQWFFFGQSTIGDDGFQWFQLKPRCTWIGVNFRFAHATGQLFVREIWHEMSKIFVLQKRTHILLLSKFKTRVHLSCCKTATLPPACWATFQRRGQPEHSTTLRWTDKWFLQLVLTKILFLVLKSHIKGFRNLHTIKEKCYLLIATSWWKLTERTNYTQICFCPIFWGREC